MMNNRRNVIVAGTLAASMAAAMTSYFESSGKMILTAYQDQGGVWTICDGITRGVRPGMTVTEDWCKTAKLEELERHSEPLAKVPYDLPVNVQVAWTDFCYNVGTGACSRSTGMKLLIAGETAEACERILDWRMTTVKGRKVDCSISSNGCNGIWTRRKAERDVCMGELSVRDAQKIFAGLPVGGVQ